MADAEIGGNQKRCCRCGMVKNYENDFHQDRSRRDGRMGFCKQCQSAKDHARRKHPAPSMLECANCGRRFCPPMWSRGDRERQFCSRRCRKYRFNSERYRPHSSTACVSCGQRFYQRREGPQRQYCSLYCKTKGAGSDCMICGTRFLPRQVRVQCCSRHCGRILEKRTKEIARSRLPLYTCQHCQELYAPSRIHGIERQNIRYCGVPCYRADLPKSRTGQKQSRESLRRNDRSHRRRASALARRVEKLDLLAIYERDGWRCGICGKRVNKALRNPHPRSASLDHIVPLSKGGDHVAENVQLAHLGCNLKKRANADGVQLRLIG